MQGALGALSIVSAVCLLILSILIGIRANKTLSGRFFLIFNLVATAWLIISYGTILNSQGVITEYGVGIVLLRASYGVGALVLYFLLLFCLYFPNYLFSRLKASALIVSATVIACGAFVISFLPSFIPSYTINHESELILASYGHAQYVYWVCLALIIIAVVYALTKQYIHSKDIIRIQVRYLFIGISLSVAFVLTTDLLLPAISQSDVTANFGQFGVLFFVAFAAFAILKHHLLDIKVIATESLVVILALILLIDAMLSKTIGTAILKWSIFVIVCFIGYRLIKSVLSEIRQKEQLQQLSNQLKSANQRLKEIDAMKTEFVSMASHELLTPISAIEGYLSMIVEEHLVTITDPKAKKYLDNIYASSRRLARLVGDLLNVSRIEQGRLALQKQVLNVDDLITQVIAELKFRAQERRMTMMPNLRIQGQAAMTYGDADKIKEVLVNLAGNSIKYTPEGGKIIITADLWPTQQVEARYQQMASHVQRNGAHTGDGALQKIVNDKYTQAVGDKQIVIAVADNGIGISPEDIGHLFQKFSRVGDWSTQEVQGTGLGLYISRALVELHHGRIWAESPGVKKGTIFYFSLPLAAYKTQVEALDAQVPKAKDAKPLARMGGGPAAKV